MKHKLILIYAWLIRTCFFFVPDFPFTMRVRGFFYGLGMKNCGRDFQVSNNTIIKNLPNISIGSNVFIGNNSILMGSGEIDVEDEVLIGPNVIIISGNHTRIKKSYRFGPADIGKIKIGKGSWVTSNCTIAKDSKLPEGSVLAANSFLNKVYEEKDYIYAGIPARKIKKND